MVSGHPRVPPRLNIAGTLADISPTLNPTCLITPSPQHQSAIYNIPRYVTQLQFYLTRTKWEFMDSVDSKPSQQRDLYCSLQSKTKLSLPASKPSWSLKNKGRPRTFQTPGHAIKVLLKTFKVRPP
ncbi:unnamed protein product [Timema podura]|uniref:Uncharacterized protein n=1 Tax=Timema podura TaxID=61482 RepID=A0ABN7P168_TIMPD|nr:unnamed protein product [Timema podura]